MTLPNPADGDTINNTDITGIKNHLEGASGNTAPYLLRQSSGNFGIRLSTADGTTKVSIQDSAGTEVASIDSDGNLVVAGTTFTALTLPTSASPSQTAEGSAVWDSDDDRLTIGDGSSRKTFYPGQFKFELVGSNTVEQTTTSTTEVDLVTITLTRSVAATEGLLIIGNASKDAGFATVVALGLKLNTTALWDPDTAVICQSSGTNQAEDGMFMLWLMPRSTGYLNGVLGWHQWQVSATGAAAVAQTAILAPQNNMISAALTQIVITGKNTTSNNNLAVKEVFVYAF